MANDKVLSAVRDQIDCCNQYSLDAVVFMVQLLNILCPNKRAQLQRIIYAIEHCEDDSSSCSS